MISLDQLVFIGKRKKLKNLYMMERDYIIEKILYIIGKYWLDRAVLKGGTALYKFYGLPRFSKDIDLEFLGPIENFEIIISTVFDELVAEGFQVERVGRDVRTGSWIISSFFVRAPTLSGEPIDMLLEIKFVESLPPHNTFTFISMYPDILDFKLRVGSIEFIFSEKIKAICDITREQVRDVFDVYFISTKYGIPVPEKPCKHFCLIIKKLLRDWDTLRDIVLIELPEKELVKRQLGCD